MALGFIYTSIAKEMGKLFINEFLFKLLQNEQYTISNPDVGCSLNSSSTDVYSEVVKATTTEIKVLRVLEIGKSYTV